MLDVTIRRATAKDIASIVALLADDEVGASRESPHDLTPYEQAFAVIDADRHTFLAVAERDGQVVGTLQLSLLAGMSREGAFRAQIGAVRVASPARGLGLGELLIRWAIDQAREWNCSLVQLTSDKTRVEAHRFYARLGFTPTHEGFRLHLGQLHL